MKDPFNFMDDVFDKMDGLFDKMDGAFDKVESMFDEIEVDNLSEKIQQVKDRYGVRHTIRNRDFEHELDKRKAVMDIRRRGKAATRNLFLFLLFTILIGAALMMFFITPQQDSTPPPLVETSAPLNPTLNNSTPETTDIPTLKTIE
jgi:hypothetical protein